MEETIDIRGYMAIIKKKFWMIALITAVAVVISVGISFILLEPVYEAKTTLIVNASKESEESILTNDNINVSEKLAVTYGEIIKSRVVLSQAIEKLNLDMTYEQLAGRVNVAPVKETQIISISVKSTDKNEAMKIANEIPKIFTEEVKRIAEAENVAVVDKAVLPEAPVEPNKGMNIAVAMVLGIMVGLFIIFLIEYMDTKIKSPQDIKDHLGIPLFEVIPNENFVAQK